MNIYEKMLSATAQIETVAKAATVETGKGKRYKAVVEADVLSAVKPIEASLGIYSYPLSRRIVDSGEIVNTYTDKQGNTVERKSLYIRLEVVYRFVNVENPEEYIDITSYGDGVDPQDKAPGKSMTYADKYALLKAYKIQTGEDPDTEASGELKAKTSEKPKQKAQAQAPAPDNMAAPMSENERLTIEALCTRLGWDPGKVFTGWPNLTREQYAKAISAMRGRLPKDDNQGAA